MIIGDHSIFLTKYQTHLGINNYSPEDRPIQTTGTMYKIPVVNGSPHLL